MIVFVGIVEKGSVGVWNVEEIMDATAPTVHVLREQERVRGH